MVMDAYLGSAAAVAPLLRCPRLAARWDRPSALALFQVSGLAGHLARAVLNVERWLAVPPPVGVALADAIEYFRHTDGPESPVGGKVRERGKAEAEGGPDALADRYDSALARLDARLPQLRGDRPVLMFERYALSLDQCLLTRLVELVVHADDLAVTLGIATPSFDERAAGLVVTTLARISQARHGTLAVVRVLARHERAPGNVSAF
jgi:hypothetical protein